jgi:hypothetical protein
MSQNQDKSKTDISEDEQRYLEQTALLGLEYVLSDFVKQFQKSARRWELMAYPAMVVFGLLAISGFWLIYSLTQDMHTMSGSIDPEMAQNLGAMSENISALNHTIADMNSTIDRMTTTVVAINNEMAEMNTAIQGMKTDTGNMANRLNAMDPMLINMAEMNQSMKAMTWTTGAMSQDMNKLNRDMGRPMRFMNNFLP